MIVQTDFLNHWKVHALCLALGRAEALTALIGLWGHCQSTRKWIFQLTPMMLSGICHYTGDSKTLLSSLVECKLLDELPDGSFEVHNWALKNASLIRNWNAHANFQKKQAIKTGLKTPPSPDQSDFKPGPRGADKIKLYKNGEETLGVAGASQEDIPSLEPPPPPPSAAKKSHQSDPCFEALVAIQGSTLSCLTDAERGRIKRALKDIQTACPGLTVEEITRRGEAYRAEFPNVTLTASALCSHWSRLAASSTSEKAKKNQGGAARLFQKDAVTPAPAGWEDAFETLYDFRSAGPWHQQQPDVRKAITRHIEAA
jgi:hypothetical protein